MRAPTILMFMGVGVVATLVAARIDDVRVLAGWNGVTPVEIAADPASVVVRRRGLSSVELSISRAGGGVAETAREAFERASRETWTDDPLAGMGATVWNGPVEHQVFFRQGWPLYAFSASSRADESLRGGVFVGGAKEKRVVAFIPLWGGLVGDAMIFGSGAWLLVCGPGLVRRVVRTRSGRCEACGYSRRGISASARCPECGVGPR
jgi:hypothetical protein